MYRDNELTIEEEDDIINMVAQKIQEQGLEMYATFMIESVKPLSFIGANMGRAFFAPIMPALNNNTAILGENFLQVLEKRENADKLLKAIDKLTKEAEEKKRIETAKNADGKTPTKKWWQRFF